MGKLNHSRSLSQHAQSAASLATNFSIGAPFPFRPRSAEAEEFNRIAVRNQRLEQIRAADKKALTAVGRGSSHRVCPPCPRPSATLSSSVKQTKNLH